MNFSILQSLIPYAALIIAMGVALSGVVLAVLGRRAAQRELESLRKADTAAALERADLDVLGFHLVHRLGQTSVRGYLDNQELRRDFDDAFNAVRFFLGRSVDVSRAEEPAQPTKVAKSTESPVGTIAPDPTELGDDWTLLAGLRRDLEKSLRASLDVRTDMRREAAGQLINRAIARKLITPPVAQELARAVSIANRAIHGEDVAPVEVQIAANVIASYLTKTQVFSPAAPDVPKTTKRYVTPDPAGGWRVVAPDSQRVSARAASQGEAVAKAREIVHKAGGGEVIIHGRDGRIRDTDTVRGRDSPRTK